MNEWHVPVAASRGAPELRNGNRFPMNADIGNVFRTRDSRLLTVSAATPSVADRLLVMVGGGALRDDPRFSTLAARMANMDALDAIIAEWMARHDAAEAMRLVRENDDVVGPIHDADDILADAHVAARDNVVRVPTAGRGVSRGGHRPGRSRVELRSSHPLTSRRGSCLVWRQPGRLLRRPARAGCLARDDAVLPLPWNAPRHVIAGKAMPR